MPLLCGAVAGPFGVPGLWGVDLGDVIGVIVVLAIIVFSGLMQMLGKAKQAQQPAPGRPRPGGRARAGQPRGKARPAAAGKLDDEIADFLRRAAQRRKPPPAQRPIAPRPAAAARGPQPGRVIAEVVPEPAGAEHVAEHVRRHLDTSDIAQEAASLGAEVVRAERKFEQHLQTAFSSGASAGSPPAAQTAATAAQPAASAAQPASPALPATAAAGLAALLADTNNARLAIVLNEILARPEERWR